MAVAPLPIAIALVPVALVVVSAHTSDFAPTFVANHASYVMLVSPVMMPEPLFAFTAVHAWGPDIPEEKE